MERNHHAGLQPLVHHPKPKRSSFQLSGFGGKNFDVNFPEKYSQLKEEIKKKLGTKELRYPMLKYVSKEEGIVKYIFDQESYQHFKDHAICISRLVPVVVSECYSVSAENMTKKVMVVRSAANNQVHEVPIVKHWMHAIKLILEGISENFFPYEFQHDGPHGVFRFNDDDSWNAFFAFVTQPVNAEQRYFEVSAGRQSKEQQIAMCRRDYAAKILPLMQQHHVVQQDQAMNQTQKLEAMVKLTKEMERVNHFGRKHENIEAGLRKFDLISKKPAGLAEWCQLYNLKHHFIRTDTEEEANDHGTYVYEVHIKVYNTDSNEMLPLLRHELGH